MEGEENNKLKVYTTAPRYMCSTLTFRSLFIVRGFPCAYNVVRVSGREEESGLGCDVVNLAETYPALSERSQPAVQTCGGWSMSLSVEWGRHQVRAMHITNTKLSTNYMVNWLIKHQEHG